MSIEYCQNFRRALTKERLEVAWCAVKGADLNCGGMSDHCPRPKDFKPERNVPLEHVTFTSKNERDLY